MQVPSNSCAEPLIHCFRSVLPKGTYLPRGAKVVLSSRLMEVKLPSNLPAAALKKSGCAGATGVASFSLPIPTLLELHVGRPTDSRLLSILSILTWTSLSSILRAARLVGLPANYRATSYQVGRETGIGYILRQIALAVMKYGKCRRQMDPLCK
jgi:hypothetical protein